MITRCTITLTLLALLTGCDEANVHYPPPKPVKPARNCVEMSKQIQDANDWLAGVQFRRSVITTDDMVGFVLNSGAANHLVGHAAEESGIERVAKLQEQAKQMRCTITHAEGA